MSEIPDVENGNAPAVRGDSILRGFFAVLLWHVIGQSLIAVAVQAFVVRHVPTLAERPHRWAPMIGLAWIGASQMIYAVPLFAWFVYRRKHKATFGVVIGLVLTVIANGIVMAILL